MQSEDNTWRDYCLRKKQERTDEAVTMWQSLERAGVSAQTILAVDFQHFGSVEANVRDLVSRLAGNYQMEVVPAGRDDYWLARGTTRPYGVTFTQDQHRSWVEFMADVAQSHACVFSTWSIEAPSLGVRFSSEGIEGGT